MAARRGEGVMRVGQWTVSPARAPLGRGGDRRARSGAMEIVAPGRSRAFLATARLGVSAQAEAARARPDAVSRTARSLPACRPERAKRPKDLHVQVLRGPQADRLVPLASRRAVRGPPHDAPYAARAPPHALRRT